MPIDFSNQFFVGVQGEKVLVQFPPHGPITKAEALNLAAWLVAVADPTRDHAEFDRVLEGVEST